MFKFYEVGGRVRDEILGLESKDIDYVAVPSGDLLRDYNTASDMFNVLIEYLKIEKYEIFLITSDCYTIRAKFPKNHKHKGVADFVMARKEVGYIPGTRTPIIEPGTLEDDLLRRDFTLNALAKDDDGTIIDLFGGIEDLKNKILKTPLPCVDTFNDDPLRICRCLRFSITKGFTIPNEMKKVIQDYDYDEKMVVVSDERIRDELFKCFKFDTNKTIILLNEFSKLRDYIFINSRLWLKPTFEE